MSAIRPSRGCAGPQRGAVASGLPTNRCDRPAEDRRSPPRGTLSGPSTQSARAVARGPPRSQRAAASEMAFAASASAAPPWRASARTARAGRGRLPVGDRAGVAIAAPIAVARPASGGGGGRGDRASPAFAASGPLAAGATAAGSLPAEPSPRPVGLAARRSRTDGPAPTAPPTLGRADAGAVGRQRRGTGPRTDEPAADRPTRRNHPPRSTRGQPHRATGPVPATPTPPTLHPPHRRTSRHARAAHRGAGTRRGARTETASPEANVAREPRPAPAGRTTRRPRSRGAPADEPGPQATPTGRHHRRRPALAGTEPPPAGCPVAARRAENHRRRGCRPPAPRGSVGRPGHRTGAVVPNPSPPGSTAPRARWRTEPESPRPASPRGRSDVPRCSPLGH